MELFPSRQTFLTKSTQNVRQIIGAKINSERLILALDTSIRQAEQAIQRSISAVSNSDIAFLMLL